VLLYVQVSWATVFETKIVTSPEGTERDNISFFAWFYRVEKLFAKHHVRIPSLTCLHTSSCFSVQAWLSVWQVIAPSGCPKAFLTDVCCCR
jgi:hypothetical protein